jgi:hypothetical protein
MADSLETSINRNKNLSHCMKLKLGLENRDFVARRDTIYLHLKT